MHDHLKTPQTIIITGGTKGIGLAITKYFVDRGAHVLAMARQQPEDFITSERCRYLTGDVRIRASHQKAVDEAVKWTGRLDCYINCAGVSLWKPLDDIDEGFWQQILDTNATGTLWGSQAAAKQLQPGGSIINISSLAGKRGSANNTAYCAAKFAVNGITQSLAKELGPKQIRCNAVCPVYVPTAHILDSLALENSPAGGQKVSDYLDGFAQTQAALRRLPRGEDVAATCGFLASDQAAAITGQCLNVDCGVLPQ